MDNWKKILIALNGRVESKELAAAVAADNFKGEFEPSDAAVDSIILQTEKLFSVQSAVSNQEIIEKINKESYPKHMKTALSKVEEKLKPIFDKLGIDYSNTLYISDKLPDLLELLDKQKEPSDGGLVESLKLDLKNAKKQLAESDINWQNKISDVQSGHQKENLKKAFFSKLNEYKWADAYSDNDIKQAVFSQKWEKITANAHLTLSDQGDILVFQKDLPDKEIYNGNKIQTFQNLIEPEINNYLKKSEPAGAQKPQTTVGTSSNDMGLSPQQARMAQVRNQFNSI